VSVTNEQFAKENDFVKYQLAGIAYSLNDIYTVVSFSID
jgi:hypothetical protein